jgi:hypothetical protein
MTQRCAVVCANRNTAALDMISNQAGARAADLYAYFAG